MSSLLKKFIENEKQGALRIKKSITSDLISYKKQVQRFKEKDLTKIKKTVNPLLYLTILFFLLTLISYYVKPNDRITVVVSLVGVFIILIYLATIAAVKNIVFVGFITQFYRVAMLIPNYSGFVMIQNKLVAVGLSIIWLTFALLDLGLIYLVIHSKLFSS